MGGMGQTKGKNKVLKLSQLLVFYSSHNSCTYADRIYQPKTSKNKKNDLEELMVMKLLSWEMWYQWSLQEAERDTFSLLKMYSIVQHICTLFTNKSL